jgi:AraC-like DNA-binding protein/quercetin dioxygenase-like cupin family protein
MKSIFQHHELNTDANFIVQEYQQPYFTSPFHFHDAYELILIVKSYGKLYAGNKVLNFNEGEIFLFGPSFAHCFYNEKSFIASGDTAHAIVVFFKEDFMGKDFFQKSELSKIKELLKKSEYGVKVDKANNLLTSLFLSIRSSTGMSSLIILLQLLENLSTHNKNNISLINNVLPKSSGNQNDASRLEAVFKYVIENFKDNINSKEAASLACLNEAAFCRYFKRRTQKTFSQFVSYVRITHSIRLLRESDMSVASVCFESGFKNISYFNRQFKELMNETPFDYRKSCLIPEDTNFL